MTNIKTSISSYKAVSQVLTFVLIAKLDVLNSCYRLITIILCN